MNNKNPTQMRRWYDQISNMTTAVYVSQKLPAEVQAMIARNLNEYIDAYRQMKRNDKNAVSVGANRIMGMYKSSNQQRWYDPSRSLHRAYTHMGTIPDIFLSEYASRIIDVSVFIEQEMLCRSHENEIVDAVESILKRNFVGFESGGGEIRLLANTLEMPAAGIPPSSHPVTLPSKFRR